MQRVAAMMLQAMESEISAQGLSFSKQSSIGGDVDSETIKDRELESLVRSLLPPDEAGQVLRGYYTSAFHAKLLQRLGQLRNETVAENGTRQPLPLPQWRLKRVAAFVDNNIDQPLLLSCLAQASGLSRMHFAALFRRATGLRPHDYVTLRRIEHAKQLLTQSNAPIVQVALSVGFQSQAHFTTVFKRVAGTTPHRWRLLHSQHELAA
jgi:AraC-like DNA-binding protein